MPFTVVTLWEYRAMDVQIANRGAHIVDFSELLEVLSQKREAHEHRKLGQARPWGLGWASPPWPWPMSLES